MKPTAKSWGVSTVTIVAAAMLGVSPTAHAALVKNGGGLIYDTDTDLTWYEGSTVAMTYSQAASWVAGLTVGDTNAGSWRLPWIADGQDWGFDHVGEMGHLFYAELGNPEGGPLTYTEPFTNLQASNYWSGTSWWRNRNLMCDFSFADGTNRAHMPWDSLYVLAVHEGNVPGCRADVNGDGQVDFFDYLDFVAALDTEDPSADFNGDETVDFFDYLDFAAAFDAGCD